MSVRLQLKAMPALRLDVRGVTPTALAALSVSEIEKLPIGHGKGLLPLAECFAVAKADGDDDLLVFEGDVSRCDRIGWQLDGGRIVVAGSAGDYVGAGMTAGQLHVQGSVGLLAACEMAGGNLRVDGDAGDYAASGLPGSMDGMRGGSLVVRGNVGERFADRMRRGTAVVFGNAGDFLASRMVAGTVALAGSAGAHVGYGMRRGSVVFAGAAPQLPATFVPAIAPAPVFWQLLARDLAQHGGPFAALAQRGMQRHLGDVSAPGKGELILVA